MRVQLRPRHPGADEERGTIAIITAISVAMLCVIAAFALDFGLAYNSKQRLQTAADAGALAAAQVYKGQTGECSTFVDNSALKALAQTAADRWAELNRPGAAGTPIEVTCDGDTALEVTYGTSGSTVVTLGQLAIDEDEITTNRAAQATIGNAEIEVGAMRPWGVCSAVLATTGSVVFVPTKHGSTSTQTSAGLCGSDAPPGGWWIAQCNGQGNSTGDTEAAVLDGCPSDDYQPVAETPTAEDPADTTSYLQAACPTGAEDANCLSSDTGNNFHLASEEWQTLVGTRFSMPVFCAPPTCDELAVSGSGANAAYAIYAMAEVELCGFEFQPRAPSTDWPTTGPCASNNPNGYQSGDVVSGGGFFVVVTGIIGSPHDGWTLNEFVEPRLTQ